MRKRKSNAERLKKLAEDLKKGKKNAADVNKDGKVDEKDLSIVHKAFSKAKKKKKKVVKKD